MKLFEKIIKRNEKLVKYLHLCLSSIICVSMLILDIERFYWICLVYSIRILKIVTLEKSTSLVMKVKSLKMLLDKSFIFAYKYVF